MSDELERLEAALRADVPEPSAEARERALAAAMAAFDRARETLADGGRRSEWAGAAFRSWLRGLASPNSNTYLAFAGAAAFALIAVFVVYLMPLSLLLSPDSAAPEASGAGEVVEDTRFDSRQLVDPSGNRARTELTELPEVLAVTSHARSDEALAPPAAPSGATDVVQANVRKSKQIAAGPGAQGVSPGSRSSGQLPPAMAYEEVVLNAPAAAEHRGRSQLAPPASGARKLARESRPDPGYRDQGRDQFADFETNPVKVVAEEPVSTFSIDVDTASYGFMRASLRNGLLPQKNAVRVEELINYFPYGYPPPQDRETPFAASVSVLPAPWNSANRLLHIGIKGYAADAGSSRRANLVFLVDTSGSMQAPNKLPLLINSLKLLLEALAPEDRVAIVTYAGSASVLLEPNPGRGKGENQCSTGTIERRRLHRGRGGDPPGLSARRAALREPRHQPGDSRHRRGLQRGNNGPRGIDGFHRAQTRRRRIPVGTGFRYGQLQRCAHAASCPERQRQPRSTSTPCRRRARRWWRKHGRCCFPIARDVKIQVEFNPAAVSEYRLIGYETRLLEREDFRNDQVDAGEIGAGHRVTAIYEFTLSGSGAERIAPLRYQRKEARNEGFQEELAFLKIRYKLPDAVASTLMTRPVTVADAVASVSEAPIDVRFAAAVAAFGQLLRGGRYTGAYGYDDIAALAQGARGDDLFGYRAEFVSLVRLAESAAAMPPLQH